MEEVIKSVLCSMSSVKLPQLKFMLSLLTTLMVFQGKATYRNLSRYSDLEEKTFARWYKRSFDFIAFNEKLLRDQLKITHRKIAAIDASFVKKSGHATEGLGWFYSGCLGKAAKGLEISAVAIVDLELNTAFTLDVQQTIDSDKPNDKRAIQESRVTLYAQQIVGLAERLKAMGITYLAQDAFYSKQKFVDPVCGSGLHVVGKLRSDANLKYLYKGRHIGRGRPRKYAGKVDLHSNLSLLTQSEDWSKGIQVYSDVLWSVCFKREIKVVVLRFERQNKIGQAVLFSTDLSLSVEDVIAYYKARFQIEFVFRDSKQYTGLMDCQARDKESIHTHVNAALACLNLMKLEDISSNDDKGRNVISILSWKRKKFNQQFMKTIFNKLGVDQSCQKIGKIYRDLSNYGAIAA